ncbi:MAG: hypothetical protein U1E60_01765 [Reyranellaceae bacterium]
MQTININGPLLSGAGNGQTFKDAVSGDLFVLDNSKTAGAGGGMKGNLMAFDFALPNANNALSLTINNINNNGGAPSLVLRDFEAGGGQQDPVTGLRSEGQPQRGHSSTPTT